MLMSLLQVSGRSITLPMALLLAPSVLPLHQTCRHMDQSPGKQPMQAATGATSTPGPWCLRWFLWQYTFAPARASPAQQLTEGPGCLAVGDPGLLTHDLASDLSAPVLLAQPTVLLWAP